MSVQIDADSDVLAGWTRFPDPAKFFQPIKFPDQEILLPLFTLRFGNRCEQTLIPQPLRKQGRPLIQRCASRSHTAAVISMAEDMHLRGYSRGN